MKFLSYFNTVFMFTTVTSFAIVGINTIKEIMINYGKKSADKRSENDKKRQEYLFNETFRDSSVIGNEEYIEEQFKISIDEFRNRLPKLKTELDKHNKDFQQNIKETLDKTIKKIRFFTFSFGLYSAFILLCAAFYATGVYTNYLSLVLFSGTISFFLILLPTVYTSISEEEAKRYFKVFIVIAGVFICSFAEWYILGISFFIIQLVLFMSGRIKFDRKNIFKNIVYIGVLYFLIHLLLIFAAYYRKQSVEIFTINIQNLICISTTEYLHHRGMFFIVVFLLLYLIITFIVPALKIYSKTKELEDNYISSRNALWEQYKNIYKFKLHIEKLEEEKNNELKSLNTIEEVDNKEFELITKKDNDNNVFIPYSGDY